MQRKGWKREQGRGQRGLCYNGNVNTKIATSMYCECQSVENEEYIFHFSRLAFIRIAWFCMRYFHLVAYSCVIMFFCLILS